MANGILTRKVARTLRAELESQDIDVLYDHGESGIDPIGSLGKLKSWFSPRYKRSTILADLDIAVILHDTKQPVALIEIEETSSKPKLLLGDVLATLLGGHVMFQGTTDLPVGPWTTLIVMARNAISADNNKLAFLEEQVNALKPHLGTPNATIGRIVMDSFQGEVDLEQKLRDHIQAALVLGKGVLK